jgi:hypothetical protein
LLAGCGGGGAAGDGDAGAAQAAARDASLRAAATAVVDLTTQAWRLSSDLQAAVLGAATAVEGISVCPYGGTVTAAWLRPPGDPAGGLLRRTADRCLAAYSPVTLIENGLSEVRIEQILVEDDRTFWRGALRHSDWSLGADAAVERRSGELDGEGVAHRAFASGQPMTMRLRGLTLQPVAGAGPAGRRVVVDALAVRREVVGSGVELYGLEGCARLSATGLDAELCVDAGSRIALLENVGPEQLTGRLRWNAGTPGGLDARLRVAPGGAAGSGRLRIELDLDRDGSFEAAATLDRTADIGLRL